MCAHSYGIPAAALGSEPPALRAVNLQGKERVLLTAPARLHLHDDSKDQGVLLSVEDYRDQTLYADSGQSRDISAFPFQITAALSRDGRMMLLNSFVTGPNSDYNLYIQHVDGPPALIGLGGALGLSPDAKWAAALDPVHQKEIRIIPTGVGEARTIHAPADHTYLGATWMADGKSLLVVATAPGRAPATYIQDIATNAARPVTAEGRYTVTFDATSMNVSPDGKYCIVTDGENHFWKQPLDGRTAVEFNGLSEGDFPLEWHNDSQNIFFARRADDGTFDVYDLNLSTGQSKSSTHYSPLDKTAFLALRPPVITPDGALAVYTAQRIFSTLFITKGIE